MDLSVHSWRKAVLSDRGPSSPLARLVALALAQHMNSHTLQTYVGAELLAGVTGLAERTVRTQLQLLVSEGWITEETASRGRAHWRKLRRARLPKQTQVAAPRAGSHEVAAVGAASRQKQARVAANHGASGGKSAHRVAARAAGDLDIDLDTDLGAASPPPAIAGKAARTRTAPPRLSPAEVDHRIRALRAAGNSSGDIAKSLSQYGVSVARVQEVA